MNAAFFIGAVAIVLCIVLVAWAFPIENDDRDWLDWDDFGDYDE